MDKFKYPVHLTSQKNKHHAANDSTNNAKCFGNRTSPFFYLLFLLFKNFKKSIPSIRKRSTSVFSPTLVPPSSFVSKNKIKIQNLKEGIF